MASRFDTLGFVALVDELERVSVLGEHQLEDDAHMTAMLIERQEILDAIQKADASELGAEVRADLSARIRQVLANNVTYISYLTRIREQIQSELSGLVHSRAAVRGYRVADAEVPTKHFQTG